MTTTRDQFASKKAFLLLFSLASIIHGMYTTYFVSTLTTIERLYEIQSKTVGAIMSATEFGQILGSLLVSYYGGRGNKPRWIAICMTMSSLAATICTSPHFLVYLNQGTVNNALMASPQQQQQQQQQPLNDNALEQTLNAGYSSNERLFSSLSSHLCSQPVIQHHQSSSASTKEQGTIEGNNQKSNNLPIGPVSNQFLENIQHPEAFEKQQQQQQQQRGGKLKQPTEIIFVIFFISLLVIGFGSTAMTTLGIPFIDDIVSREESPLYLGVTIGLRIFGPALGFLLGSACIQLNVDFPFNMTTSHEMDPANAFEWIGAWWLGLILISIPLLLLAMPMYYFSLLAKNKQTAHHNKRPTSPDDSIMSTTDHNHNDHHDDPINKSCLPHKLKNYGTNTLHNHLQKHPQQRQDHKSEDHQDEDDCGHSLDDKMIASSVPTSSTPSPTDHHPINYHHHHHHHHQHHHHNNRHQYTEYRLNDAYVDHERFPPIIQVVRVNSPHNISKEHDHIKSNLRSIDTSNLLTLNTVKSAKASPTNKFVLEQQSYCDDADSVITKSSLDSGSTLTSNGTNNHLERRRRHLSSSTSASSSDHHQDHSHHHHHHHLRHKHHKIHQTLEKQQTQHRHNNNKMNSLSNSIGRLICNKIFMLRLMSSVLHILPISGFYTFLPKYLIEQFKVGASTASAISGLAGILFVGIGAFTGGSLMRIFNVNSKIVTRWIATSALAYATGMLILMHLGCPQENMVTYDITIRDSNYIEPDISCLSSCNCHQSVYNPICVQQTTYLSPCLAGCTNYTQLDNQKIVYNDCRCHITTTTANMDHQHLLTYNIDDLSVTNGPCKSDCGNLKWYVMVFSLFVLIHATCEVGSMMLNLRCVDTKDRALALGMIAFGSSLLGTIPCSIIYGTVIDLTCIYWETSEPELSSLISFASSNQTSTTIAPPTRGACRVYDNDKFRRYLHGLTALVMIVAFVIDSILCKQASKINFFQQQSVSEGCATTDNATNTITTTTNEQLNPQQTMKAHIINPDDEDDGVVGHMSEDDELDCKLANEQSHRHVSIDCAAL